MLGYHVPRDDSTFQLSKKDKTYIDLSLAFVPSAITNDLTVLVDIRAINNAIKNIIMFMPGEVPFNRNIGSVVNSYLFDMPDEATASGISDEIRRAILFCEPRVSFRPPNPEELTGAAYMNDSPRVAGELFNQDDLGVFVNPLIESGGFEVTVKYRITGTNQIVRVQEILTPTR